MTWTRWISIVAMVVQVIFIPSPFRNIPVDVINPKLIAIFQATNSDSFSHRTVEIVHVWPQFIATIKFAILATPSSIFPLGFCGEPILSTTRLIETI
jgi:hypothetical protein